MNMIHLNKPNLNSSQTLIINSTSNLKQNLNSTPSNVSKSKNKENVLKKKINPLHLINSVPAKNTKFSDISVSPNFILKRKFDQIEKMSHQEEIVTQTNFLIYKIDELYDKFSSKIFGKEWKEEFLFELKQENIVDISEIFPKSLNTRGSHLLEYTKFWILLIEYKFSDLDLNETLSIFENAILYDQSDFQLLYEYFVKTLVENFEKKEIFALLEKKNGQNHFRVPEKIEDLSRDYFKFLLDKPEVFKDAKITRNQFSFTPITKAQKLLTEIHNINTQSNKNINNSISNHKLSSLSKNKNMNTSKFDLSDKNEANVESKIKENMNVISSETSKELKTMSQGVNTNEEDYIKEIKHKCYEQLIERNKYHLIIETTNEVSYRHILVQSGENIIDNQKVPNIIEKCDIDNSTQEKLREYIGKNDEFDLNDKKLQIEFLDKTQKTIASFKSNGKDKIEKDQEYSKEDGVIYNKSEINNKSSNTAIIDSKEPLNKKKKNNKKKKKR